MHFEREALQTSIIKKHCEQALSANEHFCVECRLFEEASIRKCSEKQLILTFNFQFNSNQLEKVTCPFFKILLKV